MGMAPAGDTTPMMHSSILHQTGPRWQGENWDFEFLILDVECVKFRWPTARQLPAKKAHPDSKEDFGCSRLRVSP